MIVFIALQCNKEDSFEPVLDIHPDFQPIINQFINEAKQRGISLDIENLVLQYDTTLSLFTCADCNSAADPARVQKEIRVNPNNRCWQYAQELEALIFHELGHCMLQRQHVTDTLPNGDPKSMMVKGDITLYAPCRYVFGQAEDCNNVHKRTYYIDELFDPQTPVPDWAK
jgi:hypothetical protein